MPTQQEIELAKKYYTQEQINQEMANPGSVKRVAAVGTPTYEQPVNGQFATTTPPVVQPRPGVTQQGNTLNVTQDIYSQLSPNTLAQAQNKGFNVQTSQAVPQAPTTPVPGSVSSILGEGFGAEDPFVSQYYKDQLSQYNQTIDPQAAYNEQLALRQAQIDATNALYRDQLNQARIQGQGRLGSGRAIQARGGLLGSSFGAAQTNKIQDANTDIENSIEQERLAVVAQIMSQARSSAADEIAAKRKAKEEGGKAFLAWMNGADDRKAAKVSKAAQLLLSLGKSPQDISDEELKQAGISRQDLTMEYTAGKSAQEQAQAAAQAAQEKAALEALKTQSEIDKNQADIINEALKTGRVYEQGGFIFDGATNQLIGNAQAVRRAGATGGGGGGGIGAGTAGVTAVSSQPGFKKLKAAEQKQALSLDNLSRELNKYKQIIAEANIGKSGVELFGKNSGLIESQLNALLFAAAEAEGTGALQAADRQVLEKVIPNPTTIAGALTSLKSGGLEGVYSKIDNQIRKYNANLANLGITPTSTYQAPTTQSSTSAPSEDAYAKYLESIK